jgi:hypothetical protein
MNEAFAGLPVDEAALRALGDLEVRNAIERRLGQAAAICRLVGATDEADESGQALGGDGLSNVMWAVCDLLEQVEALVDVSRKASHSVAMPSA